MDDLFLLSERHMALISPFFPLAHGVPRVDDRRVWRDNLGEGRATIWVRFFGRGAEMIVAERQ